MNKQRSKLLNANKYCHIYNDDDGVTNIHDTTKNQTYRIIPATYALGIIIEKHKDGELVSRNSLDVDMLEVLADLAGSNDMILNLKDKGGEQLPEENNNEPINKNLKPDDNTILCYVMNNTKTDELFITTDENYANKLYNGGDYVMRTCNIVNPPDTSPCNINEILF